MNNSEKNHPRIQAAIDATLEKMRAREDAFANRNKAERTPEQIEKERAYWERVWASKPTTKIKVSQLPTQTVVPYELARRKLAQVAQRRASEHGQPLRIPVAQVAIWREALKWIIYDKSCKIDLSRDLHLFGDTGRGKTFLALCLIETANYFAATAHHDDRHLFEWRFTELNTLYEDCVQQKSFDPMLAKQSGNWVFDELCNEPLKLKIYSNEYRFFERILTKREMGQMPKRAIYISNPTPNDLRKFYQSSRFESRWSKVVGKEIIFKGIDHRAL